MINFLPSIDQNTARKEKNKQNTNKTTKQGRFDNKWPTGK